MIKFLATVLLVVSTVLVSAQDRPNVADTQSFGVRLFLVPDADAFVEMWSRPETPKLNAFNKTQVNSKFAGVILYWGGGSDSKGQCNIHLQTKVLEGTTVLADGPEMPLCQKHQPPPAGVLALSDTIIDLVASGEPSRLVVQVNVTDKINNETLSVSAPIEVLAE